MRYSEEEVISRFTDLYFINEGKILRLRDGKQMGYYHKISGYMKFHFLGKMWMQHRLIYLVTYGSLPKSLDHIDRDKTNNQPENLRPILQIHNCVNRLIGKNNKSGYKGVSWHKVSSMWAARGSYDGSNTHIGLFSCKREAGLAYNHHALSVYGSEYAIFNQVFEDHKDSINEMETN